MEILRGFPLFLLRVSHAGTVLKRWLDCGKRAAGLMYLLERYIPESGAFRRGNLDCRAGLTGCSAVP